MSDALDAFMETAQRIVYCSLATVDRRRAHIGANPLVSCADLARRSRWTSRGQTP